MRPVTDKFRTCPVCGETKPIEEFGKQRKVCLYCINKKSSIKRRNSMTPEKYSRRNRQHPLYLNMFRCLICGNYRDREEFGFTLKEYNFIQHHCIYCKSRRKTYVASDEAKQLKKEKMLTPESKEEYKKYNKTYYKKHYKMIRDEGKKKIADLDDKYIRSRICHKSTLKRPEIPQEVVDAYRELLRLKRILKIKEEENGKG